MLLVLVLQNLFCVALLASGYYDVPCIRICVAYFCFCAKLRRGTAAVCPRYHGAILFCGVSRTTATVDATYDWFRGFQFEEPHSSSFTQLSQILLVLIRENTHKKTRALRSQTGAGYYIKVQICCNKTPFSRFAQKSQRAHFFFVLAI